MIGFEVAGGIPRLWAVAVIVCTAKYALKGSADDPFLSSSWPSCSTRSSPAKVSIYDMDVAFEATIQDLR